MGAGAGLLRSTAFLRFRVVCRVVVDGALDWGTATVRRWPVRPAWACTERVKAAACLSSDIVMVLFFFA